MLDQESLDRSIEIVRRLWSEWPEICKLRPNAVGRLICFKPDRSAKESQMEGAAGAFSGGY
jgi:hypothetical protein